MKSDFNFSQFNDDTYLITNYAGRHAFLKNSEFDAFCANSPTPETKDLLKKAWFYSDADSEDFISNYSDAIRSYRDYLFVGTGLHIFVLTSQCNLKCVYCQASTYSEGKMMSPETAEKCVELALQSPNKHLSFEFQGGEPLANFNVLRHIVLYTEEHCGDKDIQFNLVSNLTLLTDEMIAFIVQHNISVSTSLDGDQSIQNKNRPYPGNDSYKLWKSNYGKLTKALGHGLGAIQTTTKFSLNYYKEIVDEYIANGFDRVFIRPLTPLGYATTHWSAIGYTAEEFLGFYTNAFDYILEKSKEGIRISEGHAVIFLEKILNHRAGNYTELRSPCGAGLGQLAYNYDGRIYTCDEGRMMAEMGDFSFQVGTVDSDYASLCNCSVCKAMATASCLESIPQCSDCVYAPFCGTCPVLSYYEGKNIFASKPNSFKCKIYKGILDILFSKLYSGDAEDAKILYSWCRGNECTSSGSEQVHMPDS